MAEYIEREAVVQLLMKHRSYLASNVQNIPAADVAPVVHGRWINKTNPNRAVVEQRVDCSACGHIFWHTSAMSYNYCPNCGARMGDS